MARPPDQSRRDYYTEDAKPILRAVRDLRIFAAKMVGYVAVVYGAWTLSAYYFLLGLALVAFFWWRDRAIAKARPHE
jgi:hypothetical protein